MVWKCKKCNSKEKGWYKDICNNCYQHKWRIKNQDKYREYHNTYAREYNRKTGRKYEKTKRQRILRAIKRRTNEKQG